MSDERMQFKDKISKSNFETKLFKKFDHLTARRYNEDGNVMTLYYDSNTHIGTWMKGEGWIFTDKVIQEGKDSMAQLNSALAEK